MLHEMTLTRPALLCLVPLSHETPILDFMPPVAGHWAVWCWKVPKSASKRMSGSCLRYPGGTPVWEEWHKHESDKCYAFSCRKATTLGLVKGVELCLTGCRELQPFSSHEVRSPISAEEDSITSTAAHSESCYPQVFFLIFWCEQVFGVLPEASRLNVFSGKCAGKFLMNWR